MKKENKKRGERQEEKEGKKGEGSEERRGKKKKWKGEKRWKAGNSKRKIENWKKKNHKLRLVFLVQVI